MSMREQIRRHGLGAVRKALRAENRKWPSTPKPVPQADWPSGVSDRGRVAVWRSRDFLIQAFDAPHGIVRLSICRTDITPSGEWKEDIDWDELQRLKRLVGYGDADAVEVYPADGDVVNVANMRHLWVMPQPLDFKWAGHD